MAGGKLSARQKMINLMYLVFIAMLAMNMSKEVLSAFGFLKEKVVKATDKASETNSALYAAMDTNAAEQPDKYTEKKAQTDKIKQLSNDYYNYIQSVDDKMMAKVENKEDYEAMDKTDPLDNLFFKDGKKSPAGEEFVQKMNDYRDAVVAELGEDNKALAETVIARFNTDNKPPVDGMGARDWLKYHYEGFPMVASHTNFKVIQADIRGVENDVLSNLISSQQKLDLNISNYEPMVMFEKAAYFPGEKLSGKIVLGKNDPTLKAEKVTLNGRAVSEANIKAGQVIINQSAGSVGDKTLKGEFVFIQDGKEVILPIKGGYTVIPRPNESVISADKMNVVYRGLDNPITISMPGVPNNKVKASAPGLSSKGGTKYMMRPGTGKEVTINVTGTIDGKQVKTSPKTFRIKDVPKPFGAIRNLTGTVPMPKASLSKTSVGVTLPDFVFDLTFNVTGFKLKVPGQATIIVSGNRMNGQAKSAIAKAKRGDIISIFDIKSKLSNGAVKIKDAAPVNVEIK